MATAGLASIVAAGGVPVIAALAAPNGGFLTNPASNTDQGLVTAEPLYVDVVTSAALEGNGTTVALEPGETFLFDTGTDNADQRQRRLDGAQVRDRFVLRRRKRWRWRCCTRSPRRAGGGRRVKQKLPRNAEVSRWIVWMPPAPFSPSRRSSP